MVVKLVIVKIILFEKVILSFHVKQYTPFDKAAKDEKIGGVPPPKPEKFG